MENKGTESLWVEVAQNDMRNRWKKPLRRPKKVVKDNMIIW